MNLLNKLFGLFFIGVLFSCIVGCVQEPVDEDYFIDISKIKGGQKPTPPVDVSIEIADRVIILRFYTKRVDNDGKLITVDPDTGTNDHLYYLVYASSQDPSTFADPSWFYSERYYVGYVQEKNFASDPKEVTIKVASSYRGFVYVWVTSYDGGRESDHSQVVSVYIN